MLLVYKKIMHTIYRLMVCILLRSNSLQNVEEFYKNHSIFYHNMLHKEFVDHYPMLNKLKVNCDIKEGEEQMFQLDFETKKDGPFINLYYSVECVN